jgi:hypothetical protein
MSARHQMAGLIMTGQRFATLSNLDMQQCPKMFCNFVQKVLAKNSIIDKWDTAKLALEKSIDFVRATFGVQNSKLLPYDVLLVPIAYYYYKMGNEQMKPEHQKYLKDMFWRSALTGRFNNGTEGKLATDISMIDKFLNGNEYVPYIYINLSETYFKENGRFSLANSFTKAILCLFLANNPKRLDLSDSKIMTDDKQLLKCNGKNYHHFFPKAFMKKSGYSDARIVDNVVNIIIVDDYTNKYKIKDKAPSIYINEMAKTNSKLDEALASHFIGDIDKFGIAENDYEKFYSARCKIIIAKIQSMICEDKMEIAEATNLEEPIFYCSVGSIVAKGYYLPDIKRFVIIKDSEFKKNKDVFERVRNLVEGLVNDGTIAENGDNKWKFMSDYIFKSPSQASNVILNYSSNGWENWKDKNGNSLDECYRKNKQDNVK